jgi:4-hydroxy-tetrahydrodipicolinate reductase
LHNRLKIGLIGYGRMGKMVEQIALTRGHAISAIVDRHHPSQLSIVDAIPRCDLLIDFSSPEDLHRTIDLCCTHQKSLVIGTTGWSDQASFKTKAQKAEIGILYSPNFSIGMLLFKKLVSQAAKLYGHVEGYDVGGFEIHHSQKADSPSGTAKALAAAVLQEWPQKDHALYTTPEGKIPEKALHFPSLRLGFDPGTHQIRIDSPQDSITLTHHAKGREGFALGAVIAAEWLQGRVGFYTMEDLLQC